MSRKYTLSQIKETFWKKTKLNLTTGCIEWIASKDPIGYGKFKFEDTQLAHRAAYLLIKGKIPAGKEICHTCDNRACVNPLHLQLGSHKENMEDMVSKNRSAKPRGVLNGQAKLEEGAVYDIRCKYTTGDFTYKELAEEYECSPQQIGRIVRHEDWSHLKGEY